MPDFHTIYQTQADLYDQLVSREDYEGNLLKTLVQIRPLHNCRVVDFGAGSGRVTRIIAPYAETIVALDRSPHMLQKAQERMVGFAKNNWHLAASENSAIALQANWADIAIAGWSFGHTTAWYPDQWQHKIGAMLQEMRRVLKPNGTMIIIETLGTGRETPLPPSLLLDNYYKWLESTHRFTPTWIRTDYLFQSVTEAEQLARFFFGDNMANDIVKERLRILPECTGLWWYHC